MSLEPTYLPIPVSAAAKICEDYQKNAVLIVAIDDRHGCLHHTTFGLTLCDKITIARISEAVNDMLSKGKKIKQFEDLRTADETEYKARIDTLERDLYVPGCWICPQCSFQQHNAHMTPDGRVSANTKPEMRPCPNDGRDMIPLTWQQLAKESQAVALRMIKEKDMLLQAAYNLSMFLREYVAPAEAGNQADEWPIKIVVADDPDAANRLALFLQAQEQALAAAGAPVTPKPQGE